MDQPLCAILGTGYTAVNKPRKVPTVTVMVSNGHGSQRNRQLTSQQIKWADDFRRWGVQRRSQGGTEGCMLGCGGGGDGGGGWGWGVGVGWRMGSWRGEIGRAHV